MTENTTTATPSPRTLAEELHLALRHADGSPITVRELVHVLRDRGLALPLLLITIPFLVPVPTLGLSIPAGIAVCIYGYCMMLQRRPWLPEFVAQRRISYRVLHRAVRIGSALGRWLQFLLKPRLKFMLWPGANALVGLCLAFSGFFMALPLPIPFTNALPAIPIVLLLFGLLERDGVFVLAGQLATFALMGGLVAVGVLIYQFGWAGFRAMLG